MWKNVKAMPNNIKKGPFSRAFFKIKINDLFFSCSRSLGSTCSSFRGCSFFLF
jgi:hypothetical protein